MIPSDRKKKVARELIYTYDDTLINANIISLFYKNELGCHKLAKIQHPTHSMYILVTYQYMFAGIYSVKTKSSTVRMNESHLIFRMLFIYF